MYSKCDRFNTYTTFTYAALSSQVKERPELYLCCLSGPSQRVVGELYRLFTPAGT